MFFFSVYFEAQQQQQQSGERERRERGRARERETEGGKKRKFFPSFSKLDFSRKKKKKEKKTLTFSPPTLSLPLSPPLSLKTTTTTKNPSSGELTLVVWRLLRPHPVPSPLCCPRPETAPTRVGVLSFSGADDCVVGGFSRLSEDAARRAGSSLDWEHCCCFWSRCSCCGSSGSGSGGGRQQQWRRREQQRRSRCRRSARSGRILLCEAQADLGKAPVVVAELARESSWSGDCLRVGF